MRETEYHLVLCSTASVKRNCPYLLFISKLLYQNLRDVIVTSSSNKTEAKKNAKMILWDLAHLLVVISAQSLDVIERTDKG